MEWTLSYYGHGETKFSSYGELLNVYYLVMTLNYDFVKPFGGFFGGRFVCFGEFV